jgi:hypothetical protein
MRFSTILLAVSGWITLALTALPPGSPIRGLASVAFVLLGPGTAVVLLANALTAAHGTRPYGPLAAISLAVAVSLATCALVSEAFALTGMFTMVRCLIALAALTTALALLPRVAHIGEAQS